MAAAPNDMAAMQQQLQQLQAQVANNVNLQNQVAQLQGQITALQTQATATNVPNVTGNTPGAAVQGVLNYNKKEHSAFFTNATKSLTTTFSFDKRNIRPFLDDLTMHSDTYGLTDAFIVNIPAVGNVPARNVNLLTNHGEITLENCRDHIVFVGAGIATTRDSQNDAMILKCLQASIDETTKSQMTAKLGDYTIRATQSGILYLKVLLKEGAIGTRAAAANIRKKMASLDQYMVNTAKFNIQTFNRYVEQLQSELSNRGETSTDLLDNLFTAYCTVKDRPFNQHIEFLKNQYEFGQDITPTELMAQAKHKYQARQLDENWDAPSEEQEEIVALRAQVQSLKSMKDKRSKKSPVSDTKKKTTKFVRKVHRGRWAWRNKDPAPGEPLTKTVDGEEWKFCKHHGWSKHHTEECKIEQRKQAEAAASIEANAAEIEADDDEVEIEYSDDEDDE